MIRKKLTSSLKEKIKKDFRKLKKSDFDGDALAYLNRVRGAAKGRASQKKNKKEAGKKAIAKVVSKKTPSVKAKAITIGGITIEPDSKAYEILQASATNTNKTLAKFVKENEKAIEKLLADYLIAFKKECDDLIKLIHELPKKAKVFSPVRTKTITKHYVIFLLHSIKKAILETGVTYEPVFVEASFDLYGNLHVDVPRPGEYKELEGEDLLDFIDSEYPNITYIRND